MSEKAFSIRAAGRAAPVDMPAGRYIGECINTDVKRRGAVVALQFKITDEPYRRVILRHWIPVQPNMSPSSKYCNAWTMAARQEVDDAQDLSPEVFLGKTFLLDCGYRKSGEDGKFNDANIATHKGDGDFIRVHQIIERVDSQASTLVSTPMGNGNKGERGILADSGQRTASAGDVLRIFPGSKVHKASGK